MKTTGMLRLHWRAAFYAALLIVALAFTFTRDPARTAGEALAFVCAWLGITLVYGVLVLITMQTAARWRFHDAATIAILLIAAWVEAHWPGRLPNRTPDQFAIIWAIVALAGYSRIAREPSVSPANGEA